MDWVEERAAQVLERVPPWLWDGEALPVPVEDIADSVFGLLIRDVDEMGAAPGGARAHAQPRALGPVARRSR